MIDSADLDLHSLQRQPYLGSSGLGLNQILFLSWGKGSLLDKWGIIFP